MRAVLVGTIKFFFKAVSAVILAVVLFSLGAVALFFRAEEIRIDQARMTELIERFVPKNFAIKFDALDLRLVRPTGTPFAKAVHLEGANLCVRYGEDALETCFEQVSLSATVGWGGVRLEHEAWYMPRILSIAPIRLLGGHADITPANFPKKQKRSKTGGFDVADFLRKHVLPKWEAAGSRVEILPLKLYSKDRPDLTARFVLSTIEKGRVIRADLISLERKGKAGSRPLKASARLDLRRGAEWLIGGGGRRGEAWKALLTGRLAMGAARSVSVRGDADLRAWNDAKFALKSEWRGVSALRDVDLRGQLSGSKIETLFSLRMGSVHSQVRAVDIVDCAADMDLGSKTGGLKCGPQMVRLSLYQKSGFRNPRLFELAPEFELRVSNLDFGDGKRADLSLDFRLVQMDIVRALANAKGFISWGGGLKYDVAAEANISTERLSRVQKLLLETPYSIPAPFNTLDGPFDFSAQLKANQIHGDVTFASRTKFDSKEQAMHLRLDGKGVWQREGKRLVPNVIATLYVDRLHVTAPRFDLRQPPRFKPDRRFVSITPEMIAEMSRDPGESVSGATGAGVGRAGAKKRTPFNFRLAMKTSSPDTIKIATNLTKAPIPLSLDLVYEDRATPERVDGKLAAKVSGQVTVGRTSLEIFRRNATLEDLTLKLRKSGEQIVDGKLAVNYLEYDIDIELVGEVKEPEIRLSSMPPLERNQIISVLIFGRPLSDLDDDQKRSVGNLNAAFAEAALGISSLYLLASTPIESVGYDPDRELVTANVGLGGGASLELGTGGAGSSVGIRKRLSREFIFRSEVERLGSTSKQTVSALIEWVKRF